MQHRYQLLTELQDWLARFAHNGRDPTIRAVVVQALAGLAHASGELSVDDEWLSDAAIRELHVIRRRLIEALLASHRAEINELVRLFDEIAAPREKLTEVHI
jgi:hypothetical protein